MKSLRIPINIQPLFWLLAFVIGWLAAGSIDKTLIAVVVVLLSVLVHEFGHALTAIAFGQSARIELAALGGFTYRQGARLKLWQEFLVVINGPLFGLGLFVLSAWLLQIHLFTNPFLLFALQFCKMANLFWTIINLLPVMPLDGGHLLSIMLEAIFGFKGIKIAVITGMAIAISIAIFFFSVGALLPGALFLLLTFESFRALRYYKIFSEKDRDSDLQALLTEAQELEKKGDRQKALAKYQEVQARAKEGVLFVVAVESIAKIYRDEGHFTEAYQLLLPIEKVIVQENIALFHYLAFMNQDWNKVSHLSIEAYQALPKAETALLNAVAFSKLQQATAAIGWLGCAIREGLPAADHVIAREEFDAIRHESAFQELANSLSPPPPGEAQ